MYLETERMVLRDFITKDADDLYEILGDAAVMENTEPPYDRCKTESFLKDFCIERSPKGAFAATLKENNKVIGYVLFKSMDEPEIFEIGWIFNKDYWRKGYAYEICSKLIEHGFENMRLHKIVAEAIDDNKSVNLMKKLGMTSEGIQRKHTKSNEGIWCDLHWYAMLEENYFGRE